ncbi:MAG: DNA primase [Phycisphaera sp.]|nr:DNA primase [Phycisphaera sp.]
MNDRDDAKRQVQQATDIVELVGSDIAIKPRGREFVGLCPFHDDSKPSMTVVPTKQIFYCFVCNTGGSVFDWMMKYHKMTFIEALKALADRAGIKLPERSRSQSHTGENAGPTDRELIAAANEKAVLFYQHMLRDAQLGQLPRKYLEDRHINAQMIEEFQLGYAPDKWDALANYLKEKSHDPRPFELAGLIAQRDSSHQTSDIRHQTSHFDRLRHRLIFPIADALGRPIAFGGRILPGSTREDKSDAKYLNSPEHALFDKSATLYGLHLAKKAIIDSRTAVIVEGYTDVIACHQAGVRNVVATLGTALTAKHAAVLKRFAEKVVLIFDADEAGQKAADRAVEVFFTESLDVGVSVLPDEMDPAELLETSDGKERFELCVAHASDAIDYQFARLQQKFDNLDTLTGRQKLAEQYLQTLAQLGIHRSSAIRRGLIVQRLAAMLHLSENTVEQALAKAARRAPSAPPSTPEQFDQITQPPDQQGLTGPQDLLQEELAATISATRLNAVRQAQRHLIGCLIQKPELFHTPLKDGRTLDEALPPSDLPGLDERRLYQRLYDRLCEAQSCDLADLLTELASDGQAVLTQLATRSDHEVASQIGANTEALVSMLIDAAECIRQLHREREYEQTKHMASTHTDNDAHLKRLMEHHLNNPSRTRIARVRH